jgi:hypothetical protein
MADGKSIALLAAVFALGAMNAQAAACSTDAHKPVIYHFAVTNMTDKTQTVESVRTSCACLKVTDTTGRVPPGGVLPLDVIFNPAGMEGTVEKRVWVTLAPSKKIVTFDVAADVRLRLGFKPLDAAFGVIRRNETGREIVAKLSGYAADGVKLDEPVLAAKNAKVAKVETQSLRLSASALKNETDGVFDVRLGADGKSLVVKFRERNVLPGIYSEVWTIPTSDQEIPEIVFPVSARVADAVTVTPQVITVGWNEPVCARMVMVRFSNPVNPVNPVEKLSASPRENFSILSAETKPRKWGDVKITSRPKNGWRIDIENIDSREVRQFSKRPFLEVKTNLPGMELFEIPLRVVNDGGAE